METVNILESRDRLRRESGFEESVSVGEGILDDVGLLDRGFEFNQFMFLCDGLSI